MKRLAIRALSAVAFAGVASAADLPAARFSRSFRPSRFSGEGRNP
jgi:hypothetical protein